MTARAVFRLVEGRRRGRACSSLGLIGVTVLIDRTAAQHRSCFVASWPEVALIN